MSIRQEIEAGLERLMEDNMRGEGRIEDAQALLQQARNLQDGALIGRALRLLSQQQLHHAQLDEGVLAIQEAIRILNREKLHAQLAEAYYELGALRYEQVSFYAALDAWLKSLELASSNHQVRIAAQSYIGIGKVYFAFEDYTQAVYFHEMAKRFAKTQNDVYLNCELALNLAADHLKLHDFEKAETELQEAQILIDRGVANRVWRAEVYGGYGILYFEQQRFSEAQEYLSRAYLIHHQIENAWGKSHVLMMLGRTFIKLDQLDHAEECLTEASHICEHTHMAKLGIESEEMLAQLYLKQGQYQLALQHHKRLHQLRVDSLSEPGFGLHLSRQLSTRMLQIERQLERERAKVRYGGTI